MNAHGAELAAELLPLFEGYLDRKDVGDEGLYDLIRQGGVVCLGTLARHLHGDLKRVSDFPTRKHLQDLPGTFG